MPRQRLTTPVCRPVIRWPTYRFPTIAEAVRGLSADGALIDDEAIVLRDDRRSDFGALMTKRDRTPASLLAFHLLHLKGDDMGLRPLEARREELIMTALVPSKRNML